MGCETCIHKNIKNVELAISPMTKMMVRQKGDLALGMSLAAGEWRHQLGRKVLPRKMFHELRLIPLSSGLLLARKMKWQVQKRSMSLQSWRHLCLIGACYCYHSHPALAHAF